MADRPSEATEVEVVAAAMWGFSCARLGLGNPKPLGECSAEAQADMYGLAEVAIAALNSFRASAAGETGGGET